MSPQTYLEVLRKIKSDPKVFKKVLLLIGAGTLMLFLVFGKTVWLGLSALTVASSKVSQTISSPQFINQYEGLKTELGGLADLSLHTCFQRSKDFLDLKIWLERPVEENLSKIREACLGSTVAICADQNCSETQKINSQLDGGTK